MVSGRLRRGAGAAATRRLEVFRLTGLAGKKLLHLGGADFQLPAIECAKGLGCFVVTADNRPDNPGHRVGDHYENVSTVDVQPMLDVARRHKVDGVMTYASDVAAPTACYIAERLGLPGNSYSSAMILQRKDRFREFQKCLGLPHPRFSAAGSAGEARERFAGLGGKVMVKPADSSGSKGLSVISTVEEVDAAFDEAVRYSRCGVVVLEEFLEQDMLELDGDVLIRHGELAFRHYGHNYFRKDALAWVPCGEIFPGYFPPQVEERLDEQFRAVIGELGLRSGCMNFDGILSGGEPYILDIGLRSGGNFVPDLIRLSTGCDLTLAVVSAALGGDHSCATPPADEVRPVASYILNTHRAGIYAGYELSPEIREYHVASRIFVEPGTAVQPFTRGDRAFGVVFFVFPDMRTMRRTMEQLERHVVVDVKSP